jgi:hypothetical protein
MPGAWAQPVHIRPHRSVRGIYLLAGNFNGTRRNGFTIFRQPELSFEIYRPVNAFEMRTTSKLNTRVRFPSPASNIPLNREGRCFRR